MSPKMSLKCPPITRFRQIWPTYNVFNSITSAVRTLLSVGLPKPFLGSGEIVRRKTHLLTKIFFILIYDRISEFVLWLFVNRCVSSCLSKKNCWPNALLRQARQKKSPESFLYASSSDRYALRISLKVQTAWVDGQWFNSFMILLLLRLLLLSYHGLLSSEEVQRNPSHPIANFCRLSFCLLLLEAYW